MVAKIYRTNPDGTLAVDDENPRDDSIHDMDAVRRYIPNYDFLREQSQRYNAYTSSNGMRQEIALLYTDENGRLSYVPTPEELDARVKIAQSPYARYMGQDGSMQMIALVDENGRYIPSPLDGDITAREAPDIISGDESFYDGSREGPPVTAGDESFYDDSKTYQDVWRYDIHGLRGALGAYNPSSEPLADLWRGDPWARFDGSKTPDRSAMEHDHRQKTDWDFNVDGPIRATGEYVQALPDRMISEYETRSDALNSFRDRDGNTLSSQGIQNIHELQAQLSTTGLLNKDQGQRDDREPQGNRVTASGQEAAVVAQR